MLERRLLVSAAAFRQTYDDFQLNTFLGTTFLVRSIPEVRAKGVEADFMFLPFEGLYAEVVNRGLVEELQRSYRVNIAGPSTMAALLNSLQRGFRTFASQKRSSEVWRVLGAVKTEFQKFSTVLASSRKRLQQVDDDLEQLIGTRTRAITRNLRAVEQLDERASTLVIGESGESDADEGETEET